MSRRFYVDSPIQGDRAELHSTEAQHASKVMRCRVGDEVILFDDSGAEFSARISRIDRSTVQLNVLERRLIDRELSCLLTIGVAPRNRALVKRCVRRRSSLASRNWYR